MKGNKTKIHTSHTKQRPGGRLRRQTAPQAQKELFADPDHTQVRLHYEAHISDMAGRPTFFEAQLDSFLKKVELVKLRLGAYPRTDLLRSSIMVGPAGIELRLSVPARGCVDGKDHADRLHRECILDLAMQENALAVEPTELYDRPAKELSQLEKRLKHEKDLIKLTGGEPLRATTSIGDLPPVSTTIGGADPVSIHDAWSTAKAAQAAKSDTRILKVVQVLANGYILALVDGETRPRRFRANEGHDLRPGDRVRARFLTKPDRQIEHYQRVIEFDRLDE